MIESAVYRIVQELINNIIKHSGATKSLVNISMKKNKLQIFVEDNGIGMDEKKYLSPNKGFGLQNIRNRVRLLSGSISFEQSSLGGTKIFIEISV